MDDKKPLSILISGAGVAGASLALILARQPGFKLQPIITLIERSPVPRTTGQSIDIRGLAVDVMRKLGWEEEIKARHTTEKGLAFVNAKGETVAYFPQSGDPKVQSASSEYEILRGELTGLLLEGVDEAKEKGVQVNVVYGESIQSMEDREDGSGVDVNFAKGKIPNQRYDVVVAADGITSSTRSLIFGKLDKREHVEPTGLYIGFFTVPRVPGDEDTWRWGVFPPGLGIHLRPHRNKKTMGVYLTICNATKSRSPEIEPIVHADVATQKTYLRQRFQNLSCTWQVKRFLDGLDAADDFYMSHWCQVSTPQWAKGRCVILGDAAFATMGVGTSLAIIGAYTIAGELSKVESPNEVPQALQKYETTFRPFVEENVMKFPGFPQLINPQTGWGTWIMYTILRVVVALRLPQILFWALKGEEKKDAWKLPEYGW